MEKDHAPMTYRPASASFVSAGAAWKRSRNLRKLAIVLFMRRTKLTGGLKAGPSDNFHT